MSIKATAFHARAADANPSNAWIARNGYTLAREYSGAHEEALATRLGTVLADISWRWRITLEGARAGEFLSRLTTRDAGVLTPGTAHKALWLTDGGALRGAGVIARFGRESFLIAAAAPDKDWIATAAVRFDVRVRDVSDARGGLAIIGPYAQATIAQAGLDASLEPLAFRKLFWRGLDVTISRWGEHGGFEIWCDAGDGAIVWDRLMKAGRTFGLLPAGVDAMDILDMEAGVVRPRRDYQPATDGNASEPSPKSLRLQSLVEEEHLTFNGRAAYLTAAPREQIVGVEFDSEAPADADTILYQEGIASGRMLTSLYSPALRRAIGWARVENKAAGPDVRLSLLFGPDATPVAARVVDLPFLPAPAPIGV